MHLFIVALIAVIGLGITACEEPVGSDTGPAAITIADIPGIIAPAAGEVPVRTIDTAQYSGTVV